MGAKEWIPEGEKGGPWKGKEWIIYIWKYVHNIDKNRVIKSTFCKNLYKDHHNIISFDMISIYWPNWIGHGFFFFSIIIIFCIRTVAID